MDSFFHFTNMATQIVYALIASESDLFIEEVWTSIFSLRLYDQSRKVVVCCDTPTAERIRLFPELEKLINEVVVVPIPDECNTPKLKSRQIKTTVRQYVEGDFLFVDTDTVFCSPVTEIDTLECDIAAVREYHLPLSESPFRHLVVANMMNVYGVDVSGSDQWHNSGVLYVADNKKTREFYRQWNKNWRFSAMIKGMSQDEPALMRTDYDYGYIIKELPDIFNCQPSMSVRYLSDARIIHFLHMCFPADKSFCPFIDKSFYKRMHDEGGLTPAMAEEIRNVRSSFASPSCIVGWRTMNFMTSPVFPVLEKIYNEGGAASWLMLKAAKWLEKIYKYTKKRRL